MLKSWLYTNEYVFVSVYYRCIRRLVKVQAVIIKFRMEAFMQKKMADKKVPVKNLYFLSIIVEFIAIFIISYIQSELRSTFSTGNRVA